MISRVWTVAALVACSLTSSSVQPNRIRWESEPTVGTGDPSLVKPIEWAISQWGWGELVLSCRGADICVKRGFATPGGPSGEARWPGASNRCDAWIMVPGRDAVLVAHEIGHCFGVGHSTHPSSVMHPAPDLSEDRFYWVTYDDLDALDDARR